MKEFIRRISIVISMLYFGLTAFASDFELNGINYTISSLTDLTVVVDGADDIESQSLEIPKTVEYKGKTLTVVSIGAQAFKGFTKLCEIFLPSSLSSIGDEAFRGCQCLNNVTLPENLEYWGESSFRECNALKEIIFPKIITDITDYAFCDCSGLVNVILHEGIKSIGEGAFYSTSIERINLPDSLKKLGIRAFYKTKIKSITIPKNIEIISEGCFDTCSELESVIFEKETKLTTIGVSAFHNCINLASIELPKSLKTIYGAAFRGCVRLKEFFIPSLVTEISPSIIWDCPNISKLSIGEGLTTLPFEVRDDDINYTTTYKTLGSYCVYCYRGYEGEVGVRVSNTELENLKEIIIRDSSEELSLKGFRIETTMWPAFGNLDLDYYYVGPPIEDIKNWWGKTNYGSDSFKVSCPQGTGNIKTLEISGFCTENPYFYQKIDTLVLGKNIPNFIPANLYRENLKSITCFAALPPTITDENAFPTHVYTDATLYVPYGCNEVYREALGWKNFWNIEEMDPSAGVDSINYENENKGTDEVDVYSVDGCLIEHKIQFSKIKNLPMGLYIIVSEKGSRKINI